ncbi:FAD/NAD(P)-binding domain-containing protein [Penicillium macrosclerotiorum]|uniref:FAD/NAD(P)-binding domain-containing protein n=1 Tax=Penicillium macrosclerotiorum TaxID=303699 RepID=UPI0025475BAE|nr:FAD/NAD(P)-binding domain-containing protein [Penicillium macrosclerotiorum]KAJ5682227.1 FAD/NAD(P)-binding domain-containing protein [Penicillium macrosclerotiorum]
MAPLKILICGGGCAGPTLAFWLARGGHQVTIVERLPALRATGSQIDLRGAGIEVVKRMGLIETIRDKLVDEAGTSIIDSQGKVIGNLMANKTGKGAQSFTSEYEIMRGDLVRILYEATKNDVQYIFDKTVEQFEQDEDKVTAHFSDGSSGVFDVLVGADGQGSRIRRAILSPDASDPYVKFGIHVAYWFIPRIETDTNMLNCYNGTGGRIIMRRSHNPTETQVICFFRDCSPELSDIPKASVEKQKEFWTQRFQDAGWQSERFLEGMKTTDNWYCQEIVQVCTDTWSKGRAVLLGDAAHCPSPLSGMGTSSALVGAYVLAGEINRHSDQLAVAFDTYDQTLRPFVNTVQKLNPTFIRLGMPESWWGIAILRFIFRVLFLLRIPAFMSRFMAERDGDWKLPEYRNGDLRED